MKIAIFSDTFLPKVDGVSISTQQFIQRLTVKGHQFIIFCPSYSEHDANDIYGNQIVRMDSVSLPSYPEIRMAAPALNRIREAVKSFSPDIIHFQTPGFIGQFGILAAKHFNIPLVGTYHTLVSKQGTYLSPYRLLKLDALSEFFETKNPLFQLIEFISHTAEQLIAKPMIFSLCNTLYENSNLILSPSGTIKKELMEAGIKTPIRILSNGIDRTLFPGSPKNPGEHPRILYTGRISFEKNCGVVLDAFDLIRKELPDAKMNFVGDGPALESLKIRAKEKGILASVEFSGSVPHEKLYEVYRRHDIFMTASTMETQGMVVLEAISSGLPCIGVNSHALPELIHHGENGFISDEGDFSDMARNAVRILKDSSLYSTFSSHSIKISENHSLDASSERLESIYAEICAMTAKSK